MRPPAVHLTPARRHNHPVTRRGPQHARKAVELAPKDSAIVNTLALAEYRSGHWVESITAIERVMAAPNGGTPSDWFILAMARWQKGDKDEARKWFDKAVAGIKEKAPGDAESRRFWVEAAQLLGRPGPDTDATSAN
jgi:Tfp pilus assembly protein PilF